MLATIKQIHYLQHLADSAQFIKMRHPSLIPQGLMHAKFQLGLTTEDAGLRIQMYNNILNQAYAVLFRKPKTADNDDLPM